MKKSTYSNRIAKSFEKGNWRFQRLYTLRTFFNGSLPADMFLVDMAAVYTVKKGDKVFINPDSFIGLAIAMGFVKESQIIAIDKRSNIVALNNRRKCGARNIQGDFFKVVKRLVKEGVKIGYMGEDMMCLPAQIATKQGKMMKLLSTQDNLCVLELNLCVRGQRSYELPDTTLEYLKKDKGFRRALRNSNDKAGVWKYFKPFHSYLHRYLSNRMKMETSIYVKEKNQNYEAPQTHVMLKDYDSMTSGQKAWATRLLKQYAQMTSGQKAAFTRKENARLAA